jgi:hypothetical protein
MRTILNTVNIFNDAMTKCDGKMFHRKKIF